MIPNVIQKIIKLNDGREICIETGKLAKQADGSVVVKMGNAMLLATVVSKTEALEGIDFLPLSVDYQEKFASAGKIPGGFLRREGKLSDYEVLICRLVDRAIRPLFPSDYHADTQVTIQLISSDKDIIPDSLAALAASAALAVSDIPFNGPISEVRVGRIDGKLVLNPSYEQLLQSDIDMIVAASAEEILMVEGEMNEISEAEMIEALRFAHEAIKIHCIAQKELAQQVGKTEKRIYSHETNDDNLKEDMHRLLYDKIYQVVRLGTKNKKERSELIGKIKEDYIASLVLPEGAEPNLNLINRYFHEIHKKAARDLVTNEQIRLDGRKLNEIRPIWCEVNYLPSAHGSAIFTRGETQSLTTITLGTKLDEQLIDGATISGTNKFMLHYNFPGFSTGEVKPNRGPGRREVGHGNLALRALKKVLPPLDKNPYTIRIVSDILESNGSSSMATVCAGTLALMDSGIQITNPVSGIAMGLISENGKFAVLSDILGDEDHLGDMDFKITGTTKGITACQMDMKVEGLSYEVLSQALHQAKEGRIHILNEMGKALDKPRTDYKPHVPRMVNLRIPGDMIGAVIGPGGKIIQAIQKETGATVIIEEVDGEGVVNIFAIDKDAMEKALKWVKSIVTVPEVGEVYNGKVKSIMPFGAFVEFLPNKEGLLHISEIKWERLENMEGVLQVGEEVKVKLIEVDKKTGKYRLSRKALLPKPEKVTNKSDS